uniref:Uncharacterized protein n=1 Tax=Scherffelia dubia TaxID=3190 RepID=A0A142BYE0_SCHDU|nr:hypothetical protein [Scherffelia dubia]YP_009241556.1 hypothetical protein [Scherffelia dubia]AMP43432.1 hypothetical protein [Scherffelia dubia]AMP43463.1 hypothetical protein [Scherffelia dubia]
MRSEFNCVHKSGRDLDVSVFFNDEYDLENHNNHQNQKIIFRKIRRKTGKIFFKEIRFKNQKKGKNSKKDTAAYTVAYLVIFAGFSAIAIAIARCCWGYNYRGYRVLPEPLPEACVMSISRDQEIEMALWHQDTPLLEYMSLREPISRCGSLDHEIKMAIWQDPDMSIREYIYRRGGKISLRGGGGPGDVYDSITGSSSTKRRKLSAEANIAFVTPEKQKSPSKEEFEAILSHTPPVVGEHNTSQKSPTKEDLEALLLNTPPVLANSPTETPNPSQHLRSGMTPKRLSFPMSNVIPSVQTTNAHGPKTEPKPSKKKSKPVFDHQNGTTNAFPVQTEVRKIPHILTPNELAARLRNVPPKWRSLLRVDHTWLYKETYRLTIKANTYQFPWQVTNKMLDHPEFYNYYKNKGSASNPDNLPSAITRIVTNPLAKEAFQWTLETKTLPQKVQNELASFF